MKTEKNKKGFTLVELITAVVIIAILVGILMPALNMARNFAKNTKQKVQIGSIEAGINMYKNDFGEYPPSHGAGALPAGYTYCGAQTLAEAMFGMDLLGFHPDSIFDSVDAADLYPATPSEANLRRRKGLYIDRTNLGVFTVNDIFNVSLAWGGNYVICDTFEAANRAITGGTRVFAVGTPILYFRANTAGLDINPLTLQANRIYDYQDNQLIVGRGTVEDGTAKLHTDFDEAGFLGYIEDSIASTPSRIRPVRPDSFLLISAGQDGLYGTQDDICNFDPNS